LFHGMSRTSGALFTDYLPVALWYSFLGRILFLLSRGIYSMLW
jgi:hypothetical protein